MAKKFRIEGDPLQYVSIDPGPVTHIKIEEHSICRSRCDKKPCTYFCPSRVYSWSSESGGKIKVDYHRCMECLACLWGCPNNNIKWNYPQKGYGVNYRE